MRKAITAFVRYPFYAQALVFLTLVFGIAALFSIRKASFPITESRLITVSVTYQGATPKEMEEGVTPLVENALRGVVGVKEISSKSMENQSLVSILIRTDYDVDVVLNDIKNAIDKISNFPAGAENPVITKTKTTSLSGFLALTQTRGPEDIMLLKRTAQRIEDDFLGSGLISQVTLIGYPTRMEMSVEVREEVLQRYGMSFSEINAMMNKRSGVLGLTGISSDMRDIDAAYEAGNRNAIIARDMYYTRVKKFVGAYAAEMGGVDLLIFTGGVGENSFELRSWICSGMEFMGIRIDEAVNRASRGVDAILSTPESRVKVATIATNEELVIATDTYELTKDLK